MTHDTDTDTDTDARAAALLIAAIAYGDAATGQVNRGRRTYLLVKAAWIEEYGYTSWLRTLDAPCLARARHALGADMGSGAAVRREGSL